MRALTRIGLRVWLFAWVVLVACAGWGLCVASAGAVEAKPYAVKRFALQTTRTKKVEEPLSHENWGFANEPVPFTEAGGHPDGQGGGADALTSVIEFESEEIKKKEVNAKGEEEIAQVPVPTRDPRDIVVDLPAGLLGDPMAVPRCPLRLVLHSEHCPASTQIGEAVMYIHSGEADAGPIVNVEPEAGQSAEFAIETSYNVAYTLTAHVVRAEDAATGRSEYTVAVVTNSIPMEEIYKVETSFWGVPAASVHDPERGLFCHRIYTVWGCGNAQVTQTGGQVSGVSEVPFVTMPANCSLGSEQALLKTDSWEEPGRYIQAASTMPGVTGCNLLPFDPEISVRPDTLLADAPVGLGVELVVPQFEEPEGHASPELRTTSISLPEGMSVSPGVIDGVQACNAIKAEGEAIEIPTGVNGRGEALQPGELAPEGEELGLNGEPQLAPGHCPAASTIGTAKAYSPLLSEPVEGHVYLARPACGNAARGQAPCTEQAALDGNLYEQYLELGGQGRLADSGVNIKVRLKTEVNPATGQVTAVANEIAQLPFSHLQIKLNGGPRAPLDNPATCGPAVTTADFAPWAAPGMTPQGESMPGLGDATPSSFFNVDLAGDGKGTPCPVFPLSPGFVAGTVTPNAGKFSAFTMNVARADREQYVKGIQVHTPPGLLAMLSSVPLCGEPRADAGTCPESSKIGITRVASGAGSHPFEIEGNVYLTGPYGGPCPSTGGCPGTAPFGLSVVTHVVAGPFDLGDVVVRARIDVDPYDSSATITTDESGPHALPQIVFGVPVRLKRVTVNIDRPGFMLNPTNCKAQQVTARISGAQDAVANVSSPFAVGACKSLAFKPVFKAFTNGHTSRKLGASLDTRLSYPKGTLGNDANIAYVKVSLPKQLPSFIETLQKACIDTTFESDPADCPAGSVIGIARTKTPVLSSELSGPVYFVSHGGVKFPDIVVVLQGDGIRVDLVGSTFINEKTGITSTTFKTIPDVPVNSFELYLPQGANHALAANGNLCKEKSKLVMPTVFVAQNGATIHKKTKITVTGCGKHKRKRPKHKPHHRAGKSSVALGRIGVRGGHR